jgi:hypothetical protein
LHLRGAPREEQGLAEYCNNEAVKKQNDEGIRTRCTAGQGAGRGISSGGQSGDTQGLSDVTRAGSESVEELFEEGQSFAADVISGAENAPDADVAEVHTRQVPEDGVPLEYQDKD